MSFTCKDFSAKSWNYSSHFGAFTKSKQNKTLSLKIHKTNSEVLKNLDKNVDVLNIGEEMNVRSFNYASNVTGGGKFLNLHLYMFL